MSRPHLLRVSAAVVVTLGALNAAFPSPSSRATASYALVLTLGYGHLWGALIGGRRAFAASLPAVLRHPAGLVWLAAAIPLLFQAYASALTAWPALIWPLLALSVWHTCENESALARAPDRRGPAWKLGRPTAAEVGGTAAVLSLAAAAFPPEERTALGPVATSLPDLGTWGIQFSDVFAAATLFHLFSWLDVTARRRPGLVGAAHLVPALVCGAALVVPGEAALRARHVLFSPGLYLFWSALHVLQTSLARRAIRHG